MYQYNKFIQTDLVSSFSSADEVYEIDETVYEGKSYYTKIISKTYILYVEITKKPSYLVSDTLHKSLGISYTSLGCWKDSKDSRALDIKMGEKLGLKGCYEAVKSKNYTVFGYQYGVQCYSSANAEDRYDMYGPGTECSPMGTGANYFNQVYKIGKIVF